MRTLILFLSAMLMITPFTSFAGDYYTITITNQMKDELLAPVLIAPVRKDKHIFDGLYVTKAGRASNFNRRPSNAERKNRSQSNGWSWQ